MKRTLILTCVSLLLLVLVLGGCGSDAPTKKTTSTAPDNYPLKTCVVTGEKLGSMGEPFVVKYQGKTVKFCCSACLKDFNKDTAKYMGVLEAAEKKAAVD